MVHIGPKWRLCSAKKRNCEVVGSHQFGQEEPGWFCVREDLAFPTVDLAFMASGTSVKFSARHHILVNLLGLEPC